MSTTRALTETEARFVVQGCKWEWRVTMNWYKMSFRGDGNALKLNCGGSHTTPWIYSRSLSCTLKTGWEKMVSDERLLAFTRGLSTSWGYSQTLAEYIQAWEGLQRRVMWERKKLLIRQWICTPGTENLCYISEKVFLLFPMWGQWYDVYQLAVLQLNIVNIYWNDEASICKLHMYFSL